MKRFDYIYDCDNRVAEESYCYDKTELEPIYHYEIESYADLLEFVEKRESDAWEHYYYGCMDCFNGDLFTIEDLARDADPSWFDDGSTVDVYEW